MGWSTTTTILKRLRASATGPVWDKFIRRFWSSVVAFARHRGLPRADAEDVAQETLIAFSQSYRAGRYDRSKGRLSKWLFGIASRQVRYARRKNGRRGGQLASRDTESFWSSLPAKESPEEPEERERKRVLLEKCLVRARNEVEPTTFRAYYMVIHERRAPAEIAAELGIKVKAVYNAKHRVLNRIRRHRETYERLSDWEI